MIGIQVLDVKLTKNLKQIKSILSARIHLIHTIHLHHAILSFSRFVAKSFKIYYLVISISTNSHINKLRGCGEESDELLPAACLLRAPLSASAPPATPTIITFLMVF
jgi:hypothetical protein